MSFIAILIDVLQCPFCECHKGKVKLVGVYFIELSNYLPFEIIAFQCCALNKTNNPKVSSIEVNVKTYAA